MTNSQMMGKGAANPRQGEYLTLAFSHSSGPLHSRWRNNGLSADFLGDYVTTFMPAIEGLAASASRRTEIKHAVTYIANELLENAMKYHARDLDIPIKMHLELTSEHIKVSVSNGIGITQAESYRAFVEVIKNGIVEDLIVKQQEESAKSDQSTVSCLGILTMIADYDAQLDWTFEIQPTPPGGCLVTTSAVLLLNAIAGVSA
jgi:hypothetical protein